MEFGRLLPEELQKVDFTLPAEPMRNGLVLPGKPAPGKIYVGLPQWGRMEWVGNLYPPKTLEKDFLSHYVKQFNSVELNATHYRNIGSAGLKKWADAAGDKVFKFCPKMYQGITHKGPLNNKGLVLNEFMRGMEGLGEHRGPIFIQLSEFFGGRRRKELFLFLESLPKDFEFFLEIRHPDLLSNQALFDYLQSKQIGVVITDTAGRRDCAHMQLTVPKTFIRFICNEGHPTDYSRIKEWAVRLKSWLDQGIKEIYFFAHMSVEEKAPAFAKYVIDTFNEVCDAKLSPPQI